MKCRIITQKEKQKYPKIPIKRKPTQSNTINKCANLSKNRIKGLNLQKESFKNLKIKHIFQASLARFKKPYKGDPIMIKIIFYYALKINTGNEVC